MADQKASVLIGATFVVFTITLGQATNQGLTLPCLLLGLSSFIAAALGVLAIVPATRTIRGLNANTLFFGAFADLSEDEFKTRLTDILLDPHATIQAMLREVYQMGMVLHRKKYRYLSFACRIFLAGLLATFIAFLWQNPGPLRICGSAQGSVVRASAAPCTRRRSRRDRAVRRSSAARSRARASRRGAISSRDARGSARDRS